MGYKNEEVIELLWGYLVGPDFEKTGEIAEQFDLYTLYNILTSFARIAPKTSKYLEAFIPQLHQILSQINKEDPKSFEDNPDLLFHMVPDIPTFVNLWLCLATFAAWQPNYSKMQNMN